MAAAVAPIALGLMVAQATSHGADIALTANSLATAHEASEFSAAQTKKKPAARATTVKSSKSNTSDRMGGGGGKK
jgi:hypothetical protein